MGLVVGMGGGASRVSYALRSGFDIEDRYSSTVCQFSSHQIHQQSPRLFRQSWVVAVTVGRGEAVTGAVEEVSI